MVLTLIAAFSGVPAMVAGTNLRGLVLTSDVIVYGQVDRLETVEGVRLPVLKVERTLKGREAKEWTLALTSTFICDISATGVGERALFFLQPYRRDPDDALPMQEPLFLERVAARGLAPLHRITHFGRGRMPLRVVRGEERVAYYGWEVGLPPELEAVVVETPNKKEPSWQRSVPLPAMLDWVSRYVAEESAAALTPAPPSR